MRPASAKNKGRRLQQWVRDLLIELNSHLTDEDIRSTSMGAGGEDVLLSPRAREVIPFQIECKNKEEVAAMKWYQQAKEHGPHEPLLIIKENHAEPIVCVNAELFFEMVRKLYGRQDNQVIE
jgi:hypothetical protein